MALPHFQKDLEYNPNSSLVMQMLADLYFRLVPDSEKYLEYAVTGVKLNVAANNSFTQSYLYVQLSNTLVSSGFIDEALKYINMSLDYNPDNYYAPYLKIMILFAGDGNYERTTKLLRREWNKDTIRLDIVQDVAKFYDAQENFDSAYYYFKKFLKAREENGLDIHVQENVIIAELMV